MRQGISAEEIRAPRTKKLLSRGKLTSAYLVDKCEYLYEKTGTQLVDPGLYYEYKFSLAEAKRWSAEMRACLGDYTEIRHPLTDGTLCPFCASYYSVYSTDRPRCTECPVRQADRDGLACDNEGSLYKEFKDNNHYRRVVTYFNHSVVLNWMRWNNHLS